jgi:hypothetical protein
MKFQPAIAAAISFTMLSAGSAGAFPRLSIPFITGHQAAAHRDFGDLVYRASDRLIQNMRPRPGRAGMLSLNDLVIVTTVVSVDDLDQSSTLGRTASQLVLSRLSQLGYQTRDLTYLRALDVSPAGERVLSRDARRLGESSNASAVVVGTYSVGGQTIWINLRLLSAEDGALLSSADFAVPLDEDTWPLVSAHAFRPTRSPEALVYGSRFPVDPTDDKAR